MKTLIQSHIDFLERNIALEKKKLAILRKPAVQAAVARCPDATYLTVNTGEYGSKAGVWLSVTIPEEKDARLEAMASGVDTEDYLVQVDQTLYKTPRVSVTASINASTPLARGDKTLLRQLGKIHTYKSAFRSESVVCSI